MSAPGAARFRQPWFVEFHLDSWSEFVAYVVEAIENGISGVDIGDVWFRGQAIAEWPLRSSFSRMFGGLPTGEQEQLHQGMLTTFRERSAIHLDAQRLDDDRLEQVMQHYGAPTRTLDWSTSPYVAAYFALAAYLVPRPDDELGRCAIYMLNARPGHWEGVRTLRLVESVPSEHARIWAQHGRFTLTASSRSDLEQVIEEEAQGLAADAPWSLQKVTLPTSAGPVAMRDLELMGVSSETLFPGMEGTAKYALFYALDRARRSKN